jgi:hypothetical protein
LPLECDVVIAQDAVESCHLAGLYPHAVHVFRACSDVYDFQLPPQVPGIVDLIAVASGRMERHVRAAAQQAPILRIRQPVDIGRTVAAGPIGKRPRRAVVLSNYQVDERERMLAEAWGRAGVQICRIGGAGGQSFDLGVALAGVDIVVAKARAALDAMACGRAVYVFDQYGLDGWVTVESYEALEEDNFAGLATGRIASVQALSADLGRYEAAMGAINRDLVVQHHGVGEQVATILEAIEPLRSKLAPEAERRGREREELPLREISRLNALAWSWEREATTLRGRIGELAASAQSPRG